MADPKDRVLSVINSTTFNGIDFVEVVAPRTLHVHFLNKVAVADASLTATITGGDSVPTVPLLAIANADWSTDTEGRPLLTLHALTDGDFSFYTLTIIAPAVDLILGVSTFSFKATCPSDFDCAPPPHVCPPDDTQVPPIDYLAKDFLSFRQALTEFSALRYPNWVERSEADFGMMVAEVLSAVGDELSYLQDRVAAEATLPTATQRRSLVSLARLVDYEPLPATSASTVVQCTVGAAGVVNAGTRLSALAPDGTKVPYEIGTGLADTTHYQVAPIWNFTIKPYWFDDNQECWPQGATDLWVQGHGFNFTPGQALLIQTDLPGDSLRQIVHLIAAGRETVDPIFLTGGSPTPVTHIVWGSDEALIRARDLTRTTLGGNLLPATQGQRFTELFAAGTPPPSARDALPAIARMAPNSSVSSRDLRVPLPARQGTIELASRQRCHSAATARDRIAAVAAGAAGVGVRDLAAGLAGDRQRLHGRSGRVAGGGTFTHWAADALRHRRRWRQHHPLRQRCVRCLAGGWRCVPGQLPHRPWCNRQCCGRYDHRDRGGRAGTATRRPQPVRGHQRRRCGNPPSTSAAWRRRRSVPCSTAPCAPRITRQPPRRCPGCKRPALRSVGREAG